MDPQDYNQCSSGSSQEFSSTPPIFEANFDGDANGAFDNLRDILSAQLNVSVPNGLSSAPSAINLLFDTLDTPVLSPVVVSINEIPVETKQNFAPAAPLAEPPVPLAEPTAQLTEPSVQLAEPSAPLMDFDDSMPYDPDGNTLVESFINIVCGPTLLRSTFIGVDDRRTSPNGYEYLFVSRRCLWGFG